MSTITDAAQALAGLLRTAEDAGLPLPSSAEVYGYAPHYLELVDVGHISMLVAGLDELSAWSTWLDEPIDDTADPYHGKIHCHVRGMAGPIPVRVTTLVAAEVSA